MPHLVDAPVQLGETPEVVPAGQLRVITRLEVPATGAGPTTSSGAPSAGAPEQRWFSVKDIPRYEADLLHRAAVLTRRDRSEASDLVQDTFERAIRNVHRLLPGSNVRAWLYTILANRYQDLRRSDRTRASVPLGDDQPSAAAPEAPPRWAAVTPAELKAALSGLSLDLRATFEYREFERLSYAEIGRIMGVPVATVGTRLSRARARLKEILTARLDLEKTE
jgi:RNA polymerase sigma-70 factor, ECF subfamily